MTSLDYREMVGHGDSAAEWSRGKLPQGLKVRAQPLIILINALTVYQRIRSGKTIAIDAN